MRANEDVALLAKIGISQENPDWERIRILVRALSDSDDDFLSSVEFQEGLRDALSAKIVDEKQTEQKA